MSHRHGIVSALTTSPTLSPLLTTHFPDTSDPLAESEKMLSRFLRWWHRRPGTTHWAAVVAIALLAALLIGTAQRRADNAALAWGQPVSVLQAQGLLTAGKVPGITDVAVVQVPEHLVPQQALIDVSQITPLGRAVPAGSLLTAADLAELTAVSAGRRGVGIAVGDAAPKVMIGSAVELLLFVEVDPYEPVSTEPAQRVRAVVVAVEDNRWLVDISPADVEAVVRAGITGVVVPVLLG